MSYQKTSPDQQTLTINQHIPSSPQSQYPGHVSCDQRGQGFSMHFTYWRKCFHTLRVCLLEYFIVWYIVFLLNNWYYLAKQEIWCGHIAPGDIPPGKMCPNSDNCPLVTCNV